jgi:prepilin-type N-terminal cleavage/methylation domain-containing protein
MGSRGMAAGSRRTRTPPARRGRPAGDRRPPRHGERGFTLIELAIVMAVAGLMLAGAMKLLGGQLDQSRLKATRERLQMAYEALVTHYVTHRHLPCPADGALASPDADYGRARPETGGPCAAVAAINQVVPWRTLGLQEELSFDGWRQRLSYHVSAPLTTTGAAGPGDLAVRNGAASAPGSTELTGAAAFVVASRGENGLGAWLPSGQRKSTAGIPTHEAENADGSAPFVDRAYSQASGDEFDDLVIWREKSALAQAAGAVFAGAICTAADTLWAGHGCAGGSSTDECVAAGAIRSRCS